VGRLGNFFLGGGPSLPRIIHVAVVSTFEDQAKRIHSVFQAQGIKLSPSSLHYKSMCKGDRCPENQDYTCKISYPIKVTFSLVNKCFAHTHQINQSTTQAYCNIVIVCITCCCCVVPCICYERSYKIMLSKYYFSFNVIMSYYM
jgi:hypothetical protein